MLISAPFPKLHPGASLLLTLTYYLKGLCHFTSISVCISSNDEYHTAFVATPDTISMLHASEHAAETCSGNFFPAALYVKITAAATL